MIGNEDVVKKQNRIIKNFSSMSLQVCKVAKFGKIWRYSS